MATQNGLGFLGRVPIDTVLVGLLDAVSKGEVEATGLTAGLDGVALNGSVQTFPLLDRYLGTTSSKVWRGIAEGVIQEIEKRQAEILTGLQSNGAG